MKKLALIFVSSLLLYSCIGTEAINQVIHDKYSNAETRTLHGENFSITNPIPGGKFSETRKLKSVAIPAFFYWKFQSNYEADLNAGVPINLFNKYADDYAGTLDFANKLAGRKIEINIVSVPREFEFSQTSETIFLLVAAVSSEQNSIKTLSTTLKLDYKVMRDADLLDSGTIEVTEADIADYRAKLSMTKKSEISAKKFIANYLDLYDNYLYLMSRAAVDKMYLKL